MPSIALPVSLRGQLLNSVRSVVFNPISLFAANEPGVWYDPSDVANLDWRRNLLERTEEFDNAYWTKSASTIVANFATAPNGTTTADKLVENASAGITPLVRRILTTANADYTLTVYLKAAERQWVRILNATTGRAAYFDAANGVVGTVSAGAVASVTAVGNGWYRCSFRDLATAASQTYDVRLALSDGGLGYTGDGTSGILIWGAQLELGSTATDYQRISDVNTEVIERFPSATLYQDTAGTTPVTTPGQTVALALDKSKGLVLGSEIVVNGNFATDTDWVKGTGWTISGGVASYNGTDAPNAIYQSAANLDSGKSYRVSITVSLTQGALLVRPSFNSTAGQYQINSSGTYSILLSGQGGQFGLVAGSSGVRFIGSVDNISVKELPGFHATQATAASRPTYGIVPRTGRRNLLTFTEQFDNAVWVKTLTTVTANAAVAPDGTTTAELATPNDIPNNSYVIQNSSAQTGTLSFYAKEGAARYFIIVRGSYTVGDYAVFDLQSGTITRTPTFAGSTASIVSIGSGWYRCILTSSQSTAVNAFSVSGAPTGLSTSAPGGLFIWGAQLETGSTATAYQRVGSAFDVTEAGVASLSYLSFDGVDDFMVTPTITPGIDKAQVFAGVRKLSDAAPGTVLDLNGFTGTASIMLRAPQAASANYAFYSGGSLGYSGAISPSSYSAPVSNVLTGIGDIAADNVTLRVDGTQVAQVTTDQGTGNYSNLPLYIGRRQGTSIPFNGNLFSLIVRFGANLDAGTITSTETWVNGKTGAYA